MGYAQDYITKLTELLGSVKISADDFSSLTLDNAVERVVELLKKVKESGNKTLFIGNGASAALSSHHSADYSKAGGVPSLCFSDSSLLTCISNDYGYECVFEKPIRIFAKKGDVLFAISSSGESKNILKAVEAAKEKGMIVVTLSGFSESNPLRSLGDLNFYVPSEMYGLIETTHTALCHAFLDAFLSNHNFKDK